MMPRFPAMPGKGTGCALRQSPGSAMTGEQGVSQLLTPRAMPVVYTRIDTLLRLLSRRRVHDSHVSRMPAE
jgi:hypothetical protein